jgi:hypothetical protein
MISPNASRGFYLLKRKNILPTINLSSPFWQDAVGVLGCGRNARVARKDRQFSTLAAFFLPFLSVERSIHAGLGTQPVFRARLATPVHWDTN